MTETVKSELLWPGRQANRSPDLRRFFRLLALLFSMLVLGGNGLFLGRNQCLLATILCSTIVMFLQGLRIQRGALKLLVIPCGIAAITVFRPGDIDYLSLLSRFVSFLAAIQLLNVYLNERHSALCKDLYLLLRLMAFQALITSVLGNFVPDLFQPAESDIVVVRTYHTIGYIFTYHMTPLDSFVRPDGLFYEPGAFQIYLCIYLFLALHEYDDWKQGALALVSIISTYSTSGAIVSALVILPYLLQKLRAEGRSKRISTFILVALVAVVPLGFYIQANIAEKMSGGRESSYLARLSDFYTGINIIAKHPIVGIGFTKEDYSNAASTSRQATSSFPVLTLTGEDTSDGLLSMVYSIGIPLSLPFFIGLFRQTFFRKRLIFALLILLSLLGQKLFLAIFIMMVCFSGLVGKNKQLVHEFPPQKKNAFV